MSDQQEKYPSPFDRFPGEFIESSIVEDSGDEARILGYGLGSDLARHYGTSELILSVLLGDLLEEEDVAEAFEAALKFAMPITIADAAVHSARIARHLATISKNDATVVAAASLAVCEMSRYQVEQLADLFVWLDGDCHGVLPACARSDSPRDARMVEALRALVADRLAPPEVFDAQPSLIAAVVTVLHGCGLRRPEKIITVLTSMRLPIAVAEAYSVADPRIWQYPLNLPEWVYDPQDDDE